MRYAYVYGDGGLGNCLFQISTAIYYCENFNYELCLIKNSTLLFGTSIHNERNQMLRINNEYKTYDKTIFKNIKFVDNKSYQFNSIIHNDYTVNIDNNLIDKDCIRISGYNQNIDLFKTVFDKIPKYLNLHDDYCQTYILNKYGDITNGTLICIRIGSDFAHMTKINKNSYLKALDYLKLNNEEDKKIYIMSDVPIADYFGNDKFINVFESDIIQFYFGLYCKNYILSESTFHLWIAYLGTEFGKNTNKNVICFNDTDITNRNLSLETFIKLDY
jgi:hypothetical protein